MPTSIKNLSNQDALEAARVAAKDYRQEYPTELKLHDDQGCNALTFTAKYPDDTESIIQLRDVPINTTIVQLAHKLLGAIVPNVENVTATQTAYAYGQPRIPGERWDPLIFLPVEEDAAVASQLATILTRCSLQISSDAVVDNYVIPRLDRLIRLVETEDDLYKGVDKELRAKYLECLKALREVAPGLKVLDLVLCHPDPNPFNIIIDGLSSPQIVGLIDWESTRFLPFGMNAYQIRHIAVLNQNRRDVVSEAAKPIGLAFWNSLTAKIPDDHKNAVLDSMKIGLFLVGEFEEDLRMNKLAFLPLYMETLIERFDWLEELFRPLCPAVANGQKLL